MGKKNRKKNKNDDKNDDKNDNKNGIESNEYSGTNADSSNPNDKSKPFVSICTPTFNRRPFISAMIKCFEHQTYPKDRMEWIIIDDGTDKIEELVKHIPQVRYFKYDDKMVLGKKRNLMHSKAKGEIFVYMDDDDYYPPERVAHSVETLLANPNALCAGSSAIYIYFKHVKKMYQFGPYGPNHATAGTFAFKRELLKHSSYDEGAALAEEKNFLKDYTVPFVQLDPMKTIIVFSHEHNTFDKRILLEENMGNQFCKPLDTDVDKFILNKELLSFYTGEIDKLLVNYAPGKPNMKPDVLAQIITIERSRRKNAEEMAMKLSQNSQNIGISITNSDGANKDLTRDDVVKLLQDQQNQLKNMITELNARGKEIERLQEEVKKVQEQSLQVLDISEGKKAPLAETNKTDATHKTDATDYVTGVSDVEKDKEIRRLHRVLLKLNEKLMDMDAPD